MAVLNKIVVQDFRNIELQELEFSSNVNCISGGNGEGKTNLLDAIWYLSMTKSAFSANDKFNFRHGTRAFGLSGSYTLSDDKAAKINISVSENGDKKVLRDGKTYTRISDHIGLLPIVMVTPSDISLVSEGGDDRRRFTNAVLSQMDREFLSDIQCYNKLLSQRNAVLKAVEPDSDLLDAIDLQMDAYATRICECRRRFIADLEPVVQEQYEALSGGREKVGIDYRTDLDRGSLQDLLKASRDRDRILKYTTVGPQKDDFIFTMDGSPIRKVGSQGQQKSFLVSLKFAQYEIMKRSCGVPPMLLLDDLFDKLDMNRTANLLKMVAGSDFGQIFITDSNKVRLQSIVDGITEECAFFETSGGVFTR